MSEQVLQLLIAELRIDDLLKNKLF